MVYEYRCNACERCFDVSKSVKEIDRHEVCEKCGQFADRVFVPSRVHISGAKVTHAEYNPALGCVVKNKRHKEDLCKKMGVVEIGNDFKSAENIHKKFDQDLAQKREKRWEDD